MNRGFYIFRDKAVVELPLLHGLAQRAQQRNAIIRRLNEQLNEERLLLRTALHELAIANKSEPRKFAREWGRKHREGGVPFE